MWVVGLDKNKAEKSAVELLARKGYPTNTKFDLIKVFLRFTSKRCITDIYCI